MKHVLSSIVVAILLGLLLQLWYPETPGYVLSTYVVLCALIIGKKG